jgi:hypothetical protein
MAVTAYFQPKFISNHMRWKSTAQNASPYPADLNADTLKAGLIKSGTALAARGTSEGYEYVSDLLANNGTALTEENGAGYARLTLSGVSYTESGLVCTLTASALAWAAMTFSDAYAWIHDETASNATDATRPLICIYDLGGTVSGTATTLTLNVNGSGLVTWTAAA